MKKEAVRSAVNRSLSAVLRELSDGEKPQFPDREFAAVRLLSLSPHRQLFYFDDVFVLLEEENSQPSPLPPNPGKVSRLGRVHLPFRSTCPGFADAPLSRTLLVPAAAIEPSSVPGN